uniref:hypothetical protein n=1 Tax=Pleurozia purpurea TaxID=280637 RepID=UPI0001BB08DE|nr:hypothetical protein PlpuMp52 [Pleurozia purpurea]
MDKQLFFESLIATSPKKRIHRKCLLPLSKAPENCPPPLLCAGRKEVVVLPKSIQFRAFGSPAFVRYFRMGRQRAQTRNRRPRRVAERRSSRPPGKRGALYAYRALYAYGRSGSAIEERRAPLFFHCQKEEQQQFKAQGLFRLMKDINLWIAAAKALSPLRAAAPLYAATRLYAAPFGAGERRVEIKALETLRDSVMSSKVAEGKQAGTTDATPPPGALYALYAFGAKQKARRKGPLLDEIRADFRRRVAEEEMGGPRRVAPFTPPSRPSAATRRLGRLQKRTRCAAPLAAPRAATRLWVRRVDPSDAGAAALAKKKAQSKSFDPPPFTPFTPFTPQDFFATRLVQEVIRSILEGVYEPYFLSCSHGFRPGRSQHTCLKQIRRDFVGTVWFIEGFGFSQCFNKIDKQVLLGLMRRRIRDNRFLNLFYQVLETSPSPSGVKGGGCAAAAEGTGGGGPLLCNTGGLLCNIVLHELDLFVMRLKRIVDRGGKGGGGGLTVNESWQQSAALIDRTPPAHRAALYASGGAEAGKKGAALYAFVGGHRPLGQRIGTRSVRQINYVRFASDFLIGVIGPRALAERIRGLVTRFIEVRLKLSLDKKTRRKPIQSPNVLSADAFQGPFSLPNQHGSVPMRVCNQEAGSQGEKARSAALAALRKGATRLHTISGAKKIAFLGYLLISHSTRRRNQCRGGGAHWFGIGRSGGLSLPCRYAESDKASGGSGILR